MASHALPQLVLMRSKSCFARFCMGFRALSRWLGIRGPRMLFGADDPNRLRPLAGDSGAADAMLVSEHRILKAPGSNYCRFERPSRRLALSFRCSLRSGTFPSEEVSLFSCSLCSAWLPVSGRKEALRVQWCRWRTCPAGGGIWLSGSRPRPCPPLRVRARGLSVKERCLWRCVVGVRCGRVSGVWGTCACADASSSRPKRMVRVRSRQLCIGAISCTSGCTFWRFCTVVGPETAILADNFA